MTTLEEMTEEEEIRLLSSLFSPSLSLCLSLPQFVVSPTRSLCMESSRAPVPHLSLSWLMPTPMTFKPGSPPICLCKPTA